MSKQVSYNLSLPFKLKMVGCAEERSKEAAAHKVMNNQVTLEIEQGTCPTIQPSFKMETAYLSCLFPGSFCIGSSSLMTGVHTTLGTWWLLTILSSTCNHLLWLAIIRWSLPFILLIHFTNLNHL